jgi:predicted TPR repeat methyltransferase
MKNNKTDSSSEKSAAGPGEFVTEAYNLEDTQSMTAFYAKWAQDYDHQMLKELGYLSPKSISKALEKDLSETHDDPKQTQILDIGCGTGLTVIDLANAGYTNLHGIDLSSEMVEVSRSRDIYSGLKTGDVNLPLDYENDSFDAVISSGTFTHGHVGPKPLLEISRILKPGGTLACTVHMDLWESMLFKQTFDQLVQDQTLECISLSMDKFYETGEPEGWFCIYRKL